MRGACGTFVMGASSFDTGLGEQVSAVFFYLAPPGAATGDHDMDMSARFSFGASDGTTQWGMGVSLQDLNGYDTAPWDYGHSGWSDSYAIYALLYDADAPYCMGAVASLNGDGTVSLSWTLDPGDSAYIGYIAWSGVSAKAGSFTQGPSAGVSVDVGFAPSGVLFGCADPRRPEGGLSLSVGMMAEVSRFNHADYTDHTPMGFNNAVAAGLSYFLGSLGNDAETHGATADFSISVFGDAEEDPIVYLPSNEHDFATAQKFGGSLTASGFDTTLIQTAYGESYEVRYLAIGGCRAMVIYENFGADFHPAPEYVRTLDFDLECAAVLQATDFVTGVEAIGAMSLGGIDGVGNQSAASYGVTVSGPNESSPDDFQKLNAGKRFYTEGCGYLNAVSYQQALTIITGRTLDGLTGMIVDRGTTTMWNSTLGPPGSGGFGVEQLYYPYALLAFGDAIAPWVLTLPARDVSDIGAMLWGNASANGVPGVVRFDWGTTVAYGNVTPDVDLSVDDRRNPVGYGLVGLTPLTTYHYRVVAENDEGVTIGEDESFTTLAGHDTGEPTPPWDQPLALDAVRFRA